MPTKLDLLKITKLLKKRKKINTIIDFIKQTINVDDIKSFFLSFELTLFTYNVIINGYKHLPTFDMRHLVLQTLAQICDKNDGFTDEEVNKVYDDIRYIEENKMYTLISDHYLRLYNIYFFFLQTYL